VSATQITDQDGAIHPIRCGEFRSSRSRPRPAPVANNIIINELDSDTPGTDAAEFVELYDGGVGNTSLTGLIVVFYNGATDTSYRTIDLTGQSTNAQGYFTIGKRASRVLT
jgi:hypothetical protein